MRPVYRFPAAVNLADGLQIVTSRRALAAFENDIVEPEVHLLADVLTAEQ